jgi:hypothetical protein
MLQCCECSLPSHSLQDRAALLLEKFHQENPDKGFRSKEQVECDCRRRRRRRAAAALMVVVVIRGNGSSGIDACNAHHAESFDIRIDV